MRGVAGPHRQADPVSYVSESVQHRFMDKNIAAQGERGNQSRYGGASGSTGPVVTRAALKTNGLYYSSDRAGTAPIRSKGTGPGGDYDRR